MDERLIAPVMRDHGDTVLRVAAAVCGNRQDAEDVYSDVFFALWQKKEPFASDIHLKAWLVRVAVNKAKNVRKTAFNRHKAQLSDNVFASDTDVPDYNVEAALQRLDPKSRAIVYLHYYEGYGYGQIADMLGMREVSVRGRAKRAREQLKELLREEFSER